MKTLQKYKTYIRMVKHQAIILGKKRSFEAVKVLPNMTRHVTELAKKYGAIGFTYDVERSGGKRVFHVNKFKIDSKATSVRFEADENLVIKVFQTINGVEEEITDPEIRSYDESNRQSTAERVAQWTKIIRDIFLTLGAAVGVGTGVTKIVEMATSINEPDASNAGALQSNEPGNQS